MVKGKTIDYFQDEIKKYFVFDENFNCISSTLDAKSKEYNTYLADIKHEFMGIPEGHSVIIKELSSQQAKTYRKISHLKNPYLEKIYGVLEKEGHYISIHEFVGAPKSLKWTDRSLNLEEYISHFGYFSEEDACILLWQLCEGIKEIQEHNLIHGDIAPQNILLTDTYDNGKDYPLLPATSKKISLKLIDFGISKEKKNHDHNVTTIMGTKSFAAPEILDFRHPTDKVDIYSMGCLLHYMVTGKSPKDTDYKYSKKQLSRRLYHIINRCTASYEKRYHNIAKLQKEVLYKYHILSSIYKTLTYSKTEQTQSAETACNLPTHFSHYLTYFLVILPMIIRNQENRMDKK